MAMPAIVPQSASPDHILRPLADLLTHIHADDPHYGLPFACALGRAVAHVEAGCHYEPYTATHYRIQSSSRRWLWHYCTLDHCSCEAGTSEKHYVSWCWHRALLHLLTARHALSHLDRCPHPTLASAPPRPPRDMATISREADELF